MKKMYVNFGSKLRKYKSSPKSWFWEDKGDVGCDRMVFAINSNIFLSKFKYWFNKWSLDQGQKTMKTI